MPSNNISTISGVVESVNEKGFKLETGQWLNYSQYGYRGPAAGQPAPMPGQNITAQLKNDKFLHTLSIGGQPVATPQPAAQPKPAAVPAPTSAPVFVATTTTDIVNQDKLIDVTIQTRLAILKTVALAQPTMFTLDNNDTLVEVVRNLEQFVLEDLLASTTPVDDSDVTAEDLLDEDI